MTLHQIDISNFRGLKSLSWQPKPGFNLLLGAGDSGKTTILDAVDLVLGPRWTVAFADSDFTNCDHETPIMITATVGDLPKRILSDSRFELCLRGWRQGEVHDEPVDLEGDQTDEPVLSIRLTVDSSLEPVWKVYTDREPIDGPQILARDREALGIVRVGHYVDRHLSWGRGSALSQFTDEFDNLNPILANVRRQSSLAFRSQTDSLKKLTETSTKLQTEATKYGVRFQGQLVPGLGASTVAGSGSSVGLFDGEVPAQQMGLGSRRLLTITMQLGQETSKSLLLLDEIETALEPYRIRALTRKLIGEGVQVFATTHSPVCIAESAGQSFWHAQRSNGTTILTLFDSKISLLLDRCPNAVLGDRSIVCEGKTELGFLKIAIERWEEEKGTTLESIGVCQVYAEGRGNVGHIAKALLKLARTQDVERRPTRSAWRSFDERATLVCLPSGLE